jgi:hypothetical protein
MREEVATMRQYGSAECADGRVDEELCQQQDKPTPVVRKESSSTQQQWYKLFDHYGGNTFVSTDPNASGRNNRSTRLNIPLILFLLAVVVLIAYLKLQQHPSTTEDEVKSFRSKEYESLTGISTKENENTNDVIVSNSSPNLKDKTCNGNPQCAPLGLIGNCCPTDHGDFLDCCYDEFSPVKSDAVMAAETKTTATSAADATCNGNVLCPPLGLLGNCCPTDAGVFLDCCSP